MSDKTEEQWKVGASAYISLAVAIVFFSGVLYKIPSPDWQWLGAFDFTTLAGDFGKIQGTESSFTFVGANGFGAKGGFLFALALVPTVMLALGLLELFTHYGAIRAAHKLMTPLLKPILGLPGRTGLALITDLQSTDAGAALTKDLLDEGQITQKELIVMCAWQYSGAGLVNNYFATGSALFSSILVPVSIPLVIMFLLKFVGAFFVRLILNSFYKKDFQNEE